MRIEAPFTDDQVKALNAYQQTGWIPPFTCGNNSFHQDLVATPGGWICSGCDYTQGWAYAFMLAPHPSPFEGL